MWLTMNMHAVLVTIAKCAQAHKKFYAFPKEETILKNLKAYHRIEISERTLRRVLRALENSKFLETIHRTRIDKHGRKVWTSNLYKLKKKAFMWLIKLENLCQSIFSHFRRTKPSNNLLKQKQASSKEAASSVRKMLITEKDGSVFEFIPSTGEIIPLQNRPVQAI